MQGYGLTVQCTEPRKLIGKINLNTVNAYFIGLYLKAFCKAKWTVHPIFLVYLEYFF